MNLLQFKMRTHATLLFAMMSTVSCTPPPYYVLSPSTFAPYLASDLGWANGTIPLFEASDANLTQTYYFRWRVLKTHIHETGLSDPGLQWVLTEYSPNVSWAGRDDTIPCAAGHHLADARWLRDPTIPASYSRWWVSGIQGVRFNYYNFLATAIRRRLQVEGSSAIPLISALYSNLTDFYLRYANATSPPESSFLEDKDCLWNIPGNEGQERTISGPGCRPLVNSLMFGEADAMSDIAAAVGDASGSIFFKAEAEKWRMRVLKLWNENLSLFDTRINATGDFAGVREIASLSSPWYYGVIPTENASTYASSWVNAFDPEGFFGRWGLRSAELRHPKFKCPSPGCSGGCYWSGPSWPFETSKVLRAAVDILQSPSLASSVPALNRTGLWTLLAQYTTSHLPGAWVIQNVSKTNPNGIADPAILNASGYLLDGLGLSWIAELGCADEGTWTDSPSMGYLYHHSSFMDIVISGVAGVQSAAWGANGAAPSISITPLQPSDNTLTYWAVDGLRIGGADISVFWDRDGSRYNKGQGLLVLINGNRVASANTTQGPALIVTLPSSGMA
jgi:hypothetical protein